MKVRAARYADAVTLYQWANQPLVRQQAFSQCAIAWYDHLYWFYDCLLAPDRQIWLGVADGQLVGQVRFDTDIDCFWVDIHLDNAFRGKGLAAPLLREAMVKQRLLRQAAPSCQLLNLAESSLRFCAYVKLTNSASCRMFEKVGYSLVALELVQQQWCWRYEL
ncbi:MAG TPA: GNAT family N-acetyltransferase [Marinagarivorans sp.]